MGYGTGLLGGFGIGLVVAVMVLSPLTGLATNKLVDELSSFGIDHSKARFIVDLALNDVYKAFTVITIIGAVAMVVALVVEIKARVKHSKY